MEKPNTHKHLYMGTFSLYVSLFFLLESRVIYDIGSAPHATPYNGRDDFYLWMVHTPFPIRIAILIPFSIAIVYVIAYFIDKKQRTAS
ncbi:MAG: hypothetical protein FWG30_05975 [Eubacteriaceae bacterium]|nr:hypothetical protein [Eubacteriaceae bacterium]